MIHLRNSIIAIAWLISCGTAVACSDEGALFKDNFDSYRTDIWKTDGKPRVDEGELVIRPNASRTNTIYTQKTYGDVDICVDFSVTDSPDLSGTYVGIVFWASDFINLYTFQLTPDGYAAVFRLRKDRWSEVIKDEESEAIHQGIEQHNELRVVTDRKTAKLYINGHLFKEIKGTPPARGQHIGFMVESSKRGQALVRLDRLVVKPK